MPPPAAREAKTASAQGPVPRPVPGPSAELMGGQQHRLEVGLQLARFMYRKSLDRPFITMSVRDGAGRFLELPRDSHPGRYSRLANTVVFSQSLEVETPLGRLPPGAHWGGFDGPGGVFVLELGCAWAVGHASGKGDMIGGHDRGDGPATMPSRHVWHVFRPASSRSPPRPLAPPPQYPSHAPHVFRPCKCPPLCPGACLYFELRHWKGREARFSTLAWTAVPLERVLDAGPRSCRVREGVTALPLYRKPLEVCMQRARRLPGEHSTLQVALKQVARDLPAAAAQPTAA